MPVRSRSQYVSSEQISMVAVFPPDGQLDALCHLHALFFVTWTMPDDGRSLSQELIIIAVKLAKAVTKCKTAAATSCALVQRKTASNVLGSIAMRKDRQMGWYW